ncbi:MAG: sugar transferase [Bacteroidaceae bacterium]|nr:sugar transferase [Bacteroidaceae bacterium]
MQKRIFDILISLIAIIILSPLFAIIILSMLLGGCRPIIFKQERIGLHGKPFFIYKFRSMIVDAEESVPKLTEENDNRLTRIGRFLRAHHLDELPQLWNVMKGDMSFIGYRPERQYFIDKIMAQDSRYEQLYKMRPGVTSYATLYNGYTDTMEKMLRRLEYDLYYLEHHSLLFDLKILYLTVMKVVSGKKF